MSSPHPSTKTPLSPKHVQNFPRAHQQEFSVEGIFKNITSSLALLDFNEFFKKFDLDSPVCQFMEAFSTAELHALIMEAFAETNGLAHNSLAAKAVRKAKRALDDELQTLEAVFKIIERSNLNVGTVRTSLNWLREVNQRSLERLESLKDDAVLSGNPRTFEQSRYALELPNRAIPLSPSSWQQQQRRHDAYPAPQNSPRSLQGGRSYAFPPKHTGYHSISQPPSNSNHLRSPTRLSFPSQKYPIKQEEPDVPFIPPPPSPPSVSTVKRIKEKKH